MCGKMLPWSKYWKLHYYNTEYSVAGVTVARKTRRECREASTLAARHPCRRLCLSCETKKTINEI